MRDIREFPFICSDRFSKSRSGQATLRLQTAKGTTTRTEFPVALQRHRKATLLQQKRRSKNIQGGVWLAVWPTSGLAVMRRPNPLRQESEKFSNPTMTMLGKVPPTQTIVLVGMSRGTHPRKVIIPPFVERERKAKRLDPLWQTFMAQ